MDYREFDEDSQVMNQLGLKDSYVEVQIEDPEKRVAFGVLKNAVDDLYKLLELGYLRSKKAEVEVIKFFLDPDNEPLVYWATAMDIDRHEFVNMTLQYASINNDKLSKMLEICDQRTHSKARKSKVNEFVNMT
jgi:hypothetical protein